MTDSIERWGHCYRDAETNAPLDTWYPRENTPRQRGCLAEKVGIIASEAVETTIASVALPPDGVEDVYLRLHLLSECAYRPNAINLDGIFGLLPNVAWTSAGPVLPECVDELRDRVASMHHHLIVYAIDKFPRMVDYVTPVGVRIADADRVRLGAHLWPGTTVMHEGFVNFNAGTVGAAMVEGRVTPGVIVGDGVGRGGRLVDSGDAFRRGQTGERDRRAQSAGCQRRYRYLAWRSVRGGSWTLCYRGDSGAYSVGRGRQGATVVRQVRFAVSS